MQLARSKVSGFNIFVRVGDWLKASTYLQGLAMDRSSSGQKAVNYILRASAASNRDYFPDDGEKIKLPSVLKSALVALQQAHSVAVFEQPALDEDMQRLLISYSQVYHMESQLNSTNAPSLGGSDLSDDDSDTPELVDHNTWDGDDFDVPDLIHPDMH